MKQKQTEAVLANKNMMYFQLQKNKQTKNNKNSAQKIIS